MGSGGERRGQRRGALFFLVKEKKKKNKEPSPKRKGKVGGMNSERGGSLEYSVHVNYIRYHISSDWRSDNDGDVGPAILCN